MINKIEYQGIFTTKELKVGEYSVTEIWSKTTETSSEQLIVTAHSAKAAAEWIKIFEQVPCAGMVEFYDTTTGTQLLSYLVTLGYRIVSHQIIQHHSERVWHYVILQHKSGDKNAH